MIKTLMSAIAILFWTIGAFAAQPAVDAVDEAAIRHVVSEYVTGWREGDVERLSRIFDHDNGYIIWRSTNGDQQSVDSMSFAEALKKRRANLGYGLPYTIESLDIIDGYLAMVKFNVARTNGSAYSDVFTLYKIDGNWKIVVKAFTYRPASKPVAE